MVASKQNMRNSATNYVNRKIVSLANFTRYKKHFSQKSILPLIFTHKLLLTLIDCCCNYENNSGSLESNTCTNNINICFNGFEMQIFGGDADSSPLALFEDTVPFRYYITIFKRGGF